MANAFTSTDLLASLKRRGFIPSSANFTSSDFFKVVDDEMQTYIVPLLMSVKEEYLVTTESVAVTAGTNEYFVPERSIGGKVRDVQLSDGTGYYSLKRLEPSEAGEVSTSVGSTEYFYMQGNKIIIVGTVTTGTMRVKIYQRPNRVVATSAVGEITAINTGSGVVTITVPSTFTTSVTYDLVRGKPGFDTLAKDLTASAVGGASITFTPADLPSGLAVGDYVCLSQESPIAQIPVELHPLLSERTTATVLHALGDVKAAESYKIAEGMEKKLLPILTPRTEGANRVVKNKFGVGRGRNYRRY